MRLTPVVVIIIASSACSRTQKPPNVASNIVTAGHVDDYSEVGVYQQFKPQGFYVVHLPEGKLVALDTASTHLGCITGWLPKKTMFMDPCNGSRYDMQGINRTGQDPRPLERYRINLDGEQIVVDKTATFRYELGEWELPSSFIELAVAKGDGDR